MRTQKKPRQMYYGLVMKKKVSICFKSRLIGFIQLAYQASTVTSEKFVKKCTKVYF